MAALPKDANGRVQVRLSDVATYIAGAALVWLSVTVIGMKEDLAVVKASVSRIEASGCVTSGEVRSIVLEMILERVPPKEVSNALKDFEERIRALENQK